MPTIQQAALMEKKDKSWLDFKNKKIAYNHLDRCGEKASNTLS